MREIFSRRSVRQYSSKPVERGKLDEVLRAGCSAPSAMNNDERQFTAIANASVLARLNDAVFAAVSEETRNRVMSRTGGKFSFFYNAPVLIVVSHDPDALYPAADCAVALQNMFLEAESLGLSTCWINQLCTLCNAPEVREILTEIGIKPNHGVFGCCALGYSDAERAKPVSKQNKIIICE